MTKQPSIEAMLEDALPRTHSGNCPSCGGAGPTDVHAASWCRSEFLSTRWGNKPLVGCRRCGMAHQWRTLLDNALFGWWSARGVLVTPVQMARTLRALLLPPDSRVPSPRLREHVRALVAAERREKYLPRCPSCNEPYDPEDYREDAERILCARCNGVLPREAGQPRT